MSRPSTPRLLLDKASAIGKSAQNRDCLPDERVGAIDKGKGGKNRSGLAECNVNTGNSAALAGIIHARQIVEDQRSCVEVFKRNG